MYVFQATAYISDMKQRNAKPPTFTPPQPILCNDVCWYLLRHVQRELFGPRELRMSRRCALRTQDCLLSREQPRCARPPSGARPRHSAGQSYILHAEEEKNQPTSRAHFSLARLGA